MAKEALIVKTTPLPQSRISFELEIPSEIDFCQKGNLLWAQLLKNNFL